VPTNGRKCESKLETKRMIERPKQTKSSELVALMLIDTHVDVALDVALSGGGRRDRSAGYSTGCPGCAGLQN